MDDRECEGIYEELTATLGRLGLGWVIAQVTDQIRLGKTVSKEVTTLKESRDQETLPGLGPSLRKLQSGSKATFTAIVEYTPRERLLLLIDAIEQAVVNTADMEHEITALFSRESKELIPEITFYPEEEGTETFTLTPESVAPRRDYAVTLKRLLDELRAEIKDAS